MIRRKLSREVIEKQEFQIWNSFVDLLALEIEQNLSEIQKHAQRAFWYESEIQNGGHLQYFENQRKKDYSEVIDSLNYIGAEKHALLLNKASGKLFGKSRKPIKDIDEYIERAKEGEFDSFDSEYHDIQPDMNYYLNEYLKKHQEEFIEIE